MKINMVEFQQTKLKATANNKNWKESWQVKLVAPLKYKPPDRYLNPSSCSLGSQWSGHTREYSDHWTQR